MNAIVAVGKKIADAWQAVLALVALIGLLTAMATTTIGLSHVPSMLKEHDSTQTSLHKEQVRIERTQLCLTVASLRKVDWTSCALPTDGPYGVH